MKKFNNRKKLWMLFVPFLIFFVGATALVVSAVPDEIILFENEKLDLGKFFTVESETDYGGVLKDNQLASDDTERYFAQVKFGGIIPVKTVKVSVIQEQKVIPGGNSIGIKLYTDGLMVVGVSDFETSDGAFVSPARNSGIKTGDIIKSVNGLSVNKPAELVKLVEESGGGVINAEVERDGQMIKLNVKPIAAADNKYKLGMWIRNSVAGIGTMTFFNPENNVYAALGHGITDNDTNNVVPVGHGQVVPAKIISVKRSEKGSPGELHGSFSDGGEIGDVEKNSVCGIYGHVKDAAVFSHEEIEVARRDEILEGAAYILTSINGSDVGQYEIEIKKITQRKNAETKCMVIEITDPYLLEQTGGILQGMSGSPIIQNGKLVGAVTHVFLNDPTRGYGIFACTMIKHSSEI